jgi:hypothetical protein
MLKMLRLSVELPEGHSEEEYSEMVEQYASIIKDGLQYSHWYYISSLRTPKNQIVIANDTSPTSPPAFEVLREIGGRKLTILAASDDITQHDCDSALEKLIYSLET